MTFSIFEISRYLGRPDTLYQFSYKDTMFYYTDADAPITLNDIVYTALPIERGAVSTSGTLDKSSLEVSMPHDSDIPELYRSNAPSDIVTLTIFEGHSGDTDADFIIVWSGRVLSCGREGSTAKLTCEPISTSMRRPGLRRRYQYGCSHPLYGDQCRANKASFTFTATVTSVTKTTVTLSSGWNGTYDAARYVDGMVSWGEVSRSIKSISDNTLTLNGIATSLAIGDTVSVSLGCNHLMDGCSVFGNILNFGGQPWIPTKNPLAFVSNYY